MRRTQKDPKAGPRTRLLQHLALTVCALLLSACGAQAVTETTSPDPTMPAPQTASEEMAAGDPQPAPLEQDPDHCSDCHSEKQQLIDTAAPEEPVEVESKGEG